MSEALCKSYKKQGGNVSTHDFQLKLRIFVGLADIVQVHVSGGGGKPARHLYLWGMLPVTYILANIQPVANFREKDKKLSFSVMCFVFHNWCFLKVYINWTIDNGMPAQFPGPEYWPSVFFSSSSNAGEIWYFFILSLQQGILQRNTPGKWLKNNLFSLWSLVATFSNM